MAKNEVSKVDLRDVQTALSQWQTAKDFTDRTRAALSAISSRQFFSDPHARFLREAWVAAKFVEAVNMPEVRLCQEAENWPDFEARQVDKSYSMEVAEVLEPERRRGTENWDSDDVIHDPGENWIKRANQIPDTLKRSVEKKVAKNYPKNRVDLLLYLNIGEYGIRQEFVEGAMHVSTEPGNSHFRSIWVIWKNYVYLLWNGIEKNSGVFRISENEHFEDES